MSALPSPDAGGPGAPRMADRPVVLEGVTKRYPGGWTLGPLDLDVTRGETLALLGPSGCGKSTILRLLAGLVRADRGRLRVDGIELTPATVPALRLRIGYVVQEGGLFPHLTAAGNVALVARDQGWDAARVAARTRELASLVRLEAGLIEQFPAQLSGGQRQRVALMRALVLDPDVLLLDEPLGALDPMIRVRLQDELGGLFRDLKKTVLLVTHDLAEAAALADDIVLMKDG